MSARPEAPAPLRVPVVDTHCHLDIGQDGREGEADTLSVSEALAAAASVGVTRIVQVGCDLESSRWSANAADEHDHIVATVALHPNEAPRIFADHGRSALDSAYEQIAGLAAEPQVRAVGETGLDFFRTTGEGLVIQEESFRRHIAIAKAVGKPVIIHDREAHEDVVRVLLSEGPPDTVVFHCFSGGPELAQICAEHGWLMSFAGTVTFKNAQSIRDALAIAPLDLVLVETDAPFLTPVPFRGRVNASYLVPLTVRVMAEVRGIGEDEMAQALWDNAARVFGPL